MDTVQNAYLEEINEGSGFINSLKLSSDELDFIRSLIRSHSLEVVRKKAPQVYDDFSKLKLNEYHIASEKINHGEVWGKVDRIFHYENTLQIKKLPFFQKLTEMFGPFTISNEEEVFDEEIYWRFVRPQQKNDIGPLHADAWFWELGHGKMPKDCFRLKIWISIFCDEGGNGLRVVPNSHKKNYAYGSQMRGGILKPTFDETQYDLPILPLDSNPGDTVIFHDKLLHGGCFNTGQNSRYSIEFTMLLKNND